jgi:hypothetical protein
MKVNEEVSDKVLAITHYFWRPIKAINIIYLPVAHIFNNEEKNK